MAYIPIPGASGGGAPAPAKGYIPIAGGTPAGPIPSPSATTPPPQNQKKTTPPVGEGSAAPVVNSSMAPSPATTLLKPLQGSLGGGYGTSNLTDPSSGKPLLTYENQITKSSQLFSDRTAPTFDPSVPQKIPADLLKNGRMPESVSQAIKQHFDVSTAEELDHIMPLEAGGSNDLSNLRGEPGADMGKPYGPSNPTQTDPIENKLTQQLDNGEISLVQFWTEMGKAKGIILPENGGPMPDNNAVQPNKQNYSGFWGNLANAYAGMGRSIINKVQNPGATLVNDFPGLTKTLADIQTNPLSLGSSVKDILATPFTDVKQASDAFDTAVTNLAQAIKTNEPASVKINDGLEAATSFASGVLEPITMWFNIANKIPIVGTVSKLLFNVPFALLGDASGDAGVKALNALPISDDAKQNLEPGVRAISELAGQIIAGKYVAVDVLNTLTKQFGAKDAQTIMAQAKQVAATETKSQVQSQQSKPDVGGTPLTPEQESQRVIPYDSQEVLAAREKAKNIQKTIDIKTPERQALRDQVAEKVYGGGAKNKDRRVDIVMGASAAGKSSLLAEPLAQEHGSFLADNDIVKRALPEFGKGEGAGTVHDESSHILIDKILPKAIANGDNIVYPAVGKTLEGIQSFVSTMKENGYDVHLHLNDVPPEVAAERAVARFHNGGQFVDPNYVLNEVGLKPSANYDIMKKRESEKIKTFNKISNDVPKGQKPKIIENGGSLPTALSESENGDGTVSEGKRETASGGRSSILHEVRPQGSGHSIPGGSDEGGKAGTGNQEVLNKAIAAKEKMSGRGGVTLASGFNPGLDKFLETDVKPLTTAIGESGKEIAQGVNPQGASPQAQRASDIIRNSKAAIANLADVERFNNKPFMDFFSKKTTNEGIANISEYERTGEFKDAPKGYSAFFKKSMDSSREILKKAYGSDRVGYVENYVRRMFEFGSKTDEEKATSYLLNQYTGSLSATKSPLKGRVLDMPLDDAIRDMESRNIKVKPVTTNPEELRQWSMANARQALHYRQVWDSAKQEGLIKFVRNSGDVPNDMVPLDDRAAKVFAPGEFSFKGQDKSFSSAKEIGKYYANPKVARIFDNTISKGLGGSATFRAVRTIENQMNFLQLGLSGFHFTGTAINAGVSDLALGMRQILSGNTREGIGSVGRGLVPFASFTHDMIQGNNLIKDLQTGSPEASQFLQEKLNPSGGRLSLDARYRGHMADQMMQAFRDQNYVSGALRMPGAIIETVAKPLMNYAIPRVKIGAFMDLANEAIRNLPEDATPEERQRALAKSWDSIDNRFGQLVYDNQFWNKAMKDVTMTAFRSVGWNLGTIREIGGGLKDFAANTLRGKGVTDRTLYTLSLPIYVGLIGAAYQYLHTGKGPSSLKDLYYPLNGLTTKNGDPDRTSLPSYMKDVYAYGNNPFATVAHKTSPLIDTVYSLSTNQDYYGDLIRNPGDSIGTQLEQTGGYLVNNLLPFSIQQSTLAAQEGGPGQAVENFFGFTKAPGSITQSSQEAALNAKLFQKRGPSAPQTPEQQVTNQRKSDARAAIRRGDYSLAEQLVKDGIITQKGYAKFVKDAKLSPTQRKINLLPKPDRAQFESTP